MKLQFRIHENIFVLKIIFAQQLIDFVCRLNKNKIKFAALQSKEILVNFKNANFKNANI